MKFANTHNGSPLMSKAYFSHPLWFDRGNVLRVNCIDGMVFMSKCHKREASQNMIFGLLLPGTVSSQKLNLKAVKSSP